MSEILERAVGKMLLALGTRAEPERIVAFCEAVTDAHGCEQCAVRACRKMTAGMRRRPMPADLVDETRDVQDTAEHMTHVADRAALGPGSVHVWWTTEGPVHVRAAWPELSSDQAVAVASYIEDMEYVPPTPEAIAVELGFVDDHGPTVERQWWLLAHPEIVPAPPPDPRVPVGDR